MHYRRNWPWGHIQAGAIVKYLQWKDISDTAVYKLDGNDIGWGFNLSTVINAGKRVKFKLQGEYGEGFENYMADPSPDVALSTNPGNAAMPFKGKALPALGFLSFMEYEWTKKLKSSIGYSMIRIQNTNLQSPDAFRKGQYGLFNLRYYPADNIQLGVEYQYGKRNNFSDGFSSNANKIQCSFKFNFSQKTEIK
jgi:hypothetical protein